jgi:predicted LPLAT superfamily acyltransferase
MAERGSVWGLWLIVGCYRLFGRPLSLILVHAIVVYYFLTIPLARAASREYLRRIAAVPDGARALRRPPDGVASFLHFRAFALSIFDRIVLWLGRDGSFEFEVSGTDAIRGVVRPDRGAIVVGAHLGSFDALRALAERDALVVNVLMFTRNAPRINAVLRQLSPRAEMRVIEARPGAFETALRIRRCIQRGEIVAVLGDRLESGDTGRACRVPFLGAPAAFPEAPYHLAGLLDCPLFFMVALRSGPKRYRVFADLLAERVSLPREEREKRIRELVAAYASRLEHYCLSAPYQWFNFYDFWNGSERSL